MGSWCERGGARAGLFLSRAAKIPPAPPLDLFNIPYRAFDPPSQVMDKNNKPAHALGVLKLH